MPAPTHNGNAAKHYVYSFLTTGKLPPKCDYLRRQLGDFRRELDRLVLEQHGEVSMFHAARIQTCVRHEGRAQLLQKWLRDNPEIETITAAVTTTDGKKSTTGETRRTKGLTVFERIAVLKEIGVASESRDKAIGDLGLRSPVSAALQIPAPITFDSPQVPDDQPQDDAGDNRPESTDHHPDGKECGVGREGVELPASERDADQQ